MVWIPSLKIWGWLEVDRCLHGIQMEWLVRAHNLCSQAHLHIRLLHKLLVMLLGVDSHQFQWLVLTPQEHQLQQASHKLHHEAQETIHRQWQVQPTTNSKELAHQCIVHTDLEEQVEHHLNTDQLPPCNPKRKWVQDMHLWVPQCTSLPLNSDVVISPYLVLVSLDSVNRQIAAISSMRKDMICDEM